jgi:hypothetical protein
VKDSKPQGRPRSFRTPHNGPFFFENAEGQTVTLNAEQYKVMLETFLQNELRPRQLNLLWFQQDRATAHTAQISSKSLGQCFQADSFLISGTSCGPPAHLNLQYQTTSFGAMSKARYTKHILSILMT